VEPRDIIPDKQIYHVGDVMMPKVKMHCGCCFDPGLVDWAVYTSKDGQIWTQTCAISHPIGDCGWAEGYSYLDACGPDGIAVTSDMVGTLYILALWHNHKFKFRARCNCCKSPGNNKGSIPERVWRAHCCNRTYRSFRMVGRVTYRAVSNG
jgi:hypothetical protein